MKSYFSAESLYAMQKRVKKQAFYLYVFLCLMHSIKQKMLFFQNKQIRLSVPIRVIWLGFSLFLKDEKYRFSSQIRANPFFFKKTWFCGSSERRTNVEYLFDPTIKRWLFLFKFNEILQIIEQSLSILSQISHFFHRP